MFWYVLISFVPVQIVEFFGFHRPIFIFGKTYPEVSELCASGQKGTASRWTFKSYCEVKFELYMALWLQGSVGMNNFNVSVPEIWILYIHVIIYTYKNYVHICIYMYTNFVFTQFFKQSCLTFETHWPIVVSCNPYSFHMVTLPARGVLAMELMGSISVMAFACLVTGFLRSRKTVESPSEGVVGQELLEMNECFSWLETTRFQDFDPWKAVFCCFDPWKYNAVIFMTKFIKTVEYGCVCSWRWKCAAIAEFGTVFLDHASNIYSFLYMQSWLMNLLCNLSLVGDLHKAHSPRRWCVRFERKRAEKRVDSWPGGVIGAVKAWSPQQQMDVDTR